MTKRPDIPVFLPSGCLSLESIQKYMEGGFSDNERKKIALHLKECRFCNEAYEGLSLIPDPFEQEAVIRSMRQGVFRNMRNSRKGRERKLWQSRKLNVAAIAAGIVLLTGIFSVYTILLKRDRSFLAEESANRAELQFEEEMIPPSQQEKGAYDTGLYITTTEKPEIKKRSKPTPGKNQVKAVQKKDSTNAILKEEVIADEEIMDAMEVAPPVLTIEKSVPEADIQAAPMAKTSEVEPPQFNSKGLSSRVEKKSEIIISRQSASIKSDSLIHPEFISEKYTGFNDYILKNLKKLYPELIIPDEVKIEVSFLVTRDGKITNIHILRGTGTEIDKAILQLVKDSPNWLPATQKGEKIDYFMRFIVRLK